jgi:hypothetical protein
LQAQVVVLALLLGIVTTGRWAQTVAARNGERLATQPDTALHHAQPAR